jgi:hypothetical protein
LGEYALGRENELQEGGFMFDKKTFFDINFDVTVLQLQQHTLKVGYVLFLISTPY